MSAGGNLIPMAEQLPGSQFVGVDLSAVEVDMGTKMVESLKLPNVRLEQKNILDIDQSYGEFDYIIAHGVYSWIPDQVQDHLLRICKQNLSPNGVAYVMSGYGKNLALARRLLKTFDLQVGIVGRFEVRNLVALAGGDHKNEKLTESGAMKVQATAILPGNTIEANSAISGWEMGRLGFVPNYPPQPWRRVDVRERLDLR